MIERTYILIILICALVFASGCVEQSEVFIEENEALTEEKVEIFNQTINLISQTRTEDIRQSTRDSNSEVHSDYGIKKCVSCGVPFDDWGYGYPYCYYCSLGPGDCCSSY